MPCQIADLPGCDAVLISHNHYDHLDAPSIRQIRARFPEYMYFVPLGNRDWVMGMGVLAEKVGREMVWVYVGGGEGEGD